MTHANSLQNIEPLTSQMVQFLSVLETFYKTLLSESQALKNNNTDQITDLLSIKRSLSEEISSLTQQIESFLSTQNLTLSTLFKPDFSSTLPKPLQKNIQQVIDLSNQCHDLNQSNGISIQILSNINQHTLNLISGKESPNIKLYGSTGETKTSNTSKAPLGKA